MEYPRREPEINEGVLVGERSAAEGWGARASAGWESAAVRVRLGVKRGVDVVVAGTSLLVCCPLMVLIALAIRLDSPGRVLFSQYRVGHDRRRRGARFGSGDDRRRRDSFGPLFRLYKFRTMEVKADAYARTPSDAFDPRVTRVGRVLRATCLDELPQLVNVLRGEMSLVGPRPEMPFIVATYNDLQRERLKVKPGLTGLWQLRGPRDRAIHESIEFDLQYVRQWSLRLDALILLETVMFALGSRNC